MNVGGGFWFVFDDQDTHGVARGEGPTRAEVKADVLQARAEGTLIPAGQGEYSGAEQTVHMARATTTSAQNVAMHAAN